MTNNKTIAKFLAESNKIEGYDYPVGDYLDYLNHAVDIGTGSKSLLIRDSVCTWITIERGAEILRTSASRQFPHNILTTHAGQMSSDQGLKENQKGRFRTESVFIGNQEAPHFSKIEKLIAEFCKLFNEGKAHPLKLHYFFEYIHPFIDGNGRVGRLLYALYILRRGEELKPFLDNFIVPIKNCVNNDFSTAAYNIFRQKRTRYYQACAGFKEDYLHGTKHEGWWEVLGCGDFE